MFKHKDNHELQKLSKVQSKNIPHCVVSLWLASETCAITTVTCVYYKQTNMQDRK